MGVIDGYHGTDPSTARRLIAGQVNVQLGGGELGIGFYLAEYLWVAKAWAKQRHSANSVVEFDIDEVHFLSLDPLTLDYQQTISRRSEIRRRRLTRVFQFLRNIVWSPIVGKTTLIHTHQYKYESQIAQDTLNGDSVSRSLR